MNSFLVFRGPVVNEFDWQIAAIVRLKTINTKFEGVPFGTSEPEGLTVSAAAEIDRVPCIQQCVCAVHYTELGWHRDCREGSAN